MSAIVFFSGRRFRRRRRRIHLAVVVVIFGVRSADIGDGGGSVEIAVDQTPLISGIDRHGNVDAVHWGSVWRRGGVTKKMEKGKREECEEKRKRKRKERETREAERHVKAIEEKHKRRMERRRRGSRSGENK